MAIIAFRNRVAENCNAEVTSEIAVNGDKPSNRLVENAVMLLRGVSRTIKCHVESCTQEELREDSPMLPWLVEHARSILSWCHKKRTQEFVPFWEEEVLAKPISSEPLNRMNP